MAKLRQLDPNHLFGGHAVGLIGQIIQGLRPETQIPARGGDPVYCHDAQAVGPHLDYLGAEWRTHPMSVNHAKLWSGGSR